MIEFRCECGQAIRIPESLSDREGVCPGCGRRTRVPIVGAGGWLAVTAEYFKEPTIAWPTMDEHPDVPARTLLPGLLNFYCWLGFWIWFGAPLRDRSPDLASLGWNE